MRNKFGYVNSYLWLNLTRFVKRECVFLDLNMCGIIITQLEEKGKAEELPRVGMDFDLHVGFLASPNT